MATKEETIKELKKLNDDDCTDDQMKKTLADITLEDVDKEFEKISSIINSFNKVFPVVSEFCEDDD